MCALNENREKTHLVTECLLIKGQIYHVTLTSRRIVLTGAADKISRTISLASVERVERGADASGDPVIAVSVPSGGGESHKVILHFSRRLHTNADHLGLLWSAEIGRLANRPVDILPEIVQAAVPIAPSYCSTCGKRLAEKSVFCDGCGTRVPVRDIPDHREPAYGKTRHKISLQENSPQTADAARDERIPPVRKDPKSRKHSATSSPVIRHPWRKTFFFSHSGISKYSLLAGICLAAVIVGVGAYGVTSHSGSVGISLIQNGLNLTLPGISSIALPGDGSTTAVVQDLSGTLANSEDTSGPGTFTDPSLVIPTPAPGDPSSVLAGYPALFNRGDTAGIRAVLSDSLNSEYSAETMGSDLEASRSSGYRIDNIDIKNRIIEGENAVLVAAISWNGGETPLTTTQNIVAVYENNQWKLGSLVLHP